MHMLIDSVHTFSSNFFFLLTQTGGLLEIHEVKHIWFKI